MLLNQEVTFFRDVSHRLTTPAILRVIIRQPISPKPWLHDVVFVLPRFRLSGSKTVRATAVFWSLSRVVLKCRASTARQPSIAPNKLCYLSDHAHLSSHHVFHSGFCFVHFEHERDAQDCIDALNGRPWGRRERSLRVEFAKNDANVRQRERARRQAAEPNTSLFVAGFDPRGTRQQDLENAFEVFGRLRRCEIKKTFAFVEFENIEDAKEAHNAMHGKVLDGRELTVEYVAKKPRSGDDDRGDRDRGRDRGPRGGGYGDRPRFDDGPLPRAPRLHDRGPPPRSAVGGRGYGGRRERSRSLDRNGGAPRYGRRDRTRSPPPHQHGGRRKSPPRAGAAYSGRRRSRSPFRSPGRGFSPPRRMAPSRSKSPMGYRR